jgi:hypothetical protein
MPIRFVTPAREELERLGALQAIHDYSNGSVTKVANPTMSKIAASSAATEIGSTNFDHGAR